MDLCVRCVLSRVRVEGVAAEAVAAASRLNKFPRAPFAVRRGSCLRLGASEVGDPRISSRSRAMVSRGRPTLAGLVLGWVVVVWRRRFFFLVGMIFCCASSSFFVLLLEGCPALPGRLARPRRRNRILVLFHLEGTHIAVLKAIDGEGWCRRVGCTCVSLFFQRRSEEVGEQHGGDYAVVEDDDLLGSGCRILCCRGLLARFRDDDTELRRSSCFTGCFRVLFVILVFSACIRVCLYGLRTLYYVVI